MVGCARKRKSGSFRVMVETGGSLEKGGLGGWKLKDGIPVFERIFKKKPVN